MCVVVFASGEKGATHTHTHTHTQERETSPKRRRMCVCVYVCVTLLRTHHSGSGSIRERKRKSDMSEGRKRRLLFFLSSFLLPPSSLSSSSPTALPSQTHAIFPVLPSPSSSTTNVLHPLKTLIHTRTQTAFCFPDGFFFSPSLPLPLLSLFLSLPLLFALHTVHRTHRSDFNDKGEETTRPGRTLAGRKETTEQKPLVPSWVDCRPFASCSASLARIAFLSLKKGGWRRWAASHAL